MSSAWLLPEHFADVLPSQARHIEDLRRRLLDVARGYGCELVMPPLLEHIESLLSGTARELDLVTFKLVDQLSGRTLGLRADSTPQVARIDAHLLNRLGVTRLCYCGPVLHTRAASGRSTREPLQFGAEIFGHAGLEADLEVQDLALDCLRAVGVANATLDLGDARIVRGVLAGIELQGDTLVRVCMALAGKDIAMLGELAQRFPAGVRGALLALATMYGGDEVLDRARLELPRHALIDAAVNDLRWLADHARRAHPEVQVGYDLADLSGYSYYSGARFAVFAPGSSDALVRGGRYDEVGAVFGRKRPAVGFSVVDLKELAQLAPGNGLRAAIRAPWAEEPSLRSAIRELRERGETVVCVLPGHEQEVQEFACDRELMLRDGAWAVRPLSGASLETTS